MTYVLFITKISQWRHIKSIIFKKRGIRGLPVESNSRLFTNDNYIYSIMQTKYFFSTNWHPTLVTILNTFHIQFSLWRRHSGKGLVLDSSQSKYAEIDVNFPYKVIYTKRFQTCFTKVRIKYQWPWEPDRRSNFFVSPPAHLCAVTYMYITKISLNVTFNFTRPRTQYLTMTAHTY